MSFRITRFQENGRNIVLSRRAILEEERQESLALVLDQLHVGSEFNGEVVSLKPYGAFVDIGGIQGMVHISQITHGHIEDPSEVLQVGQKVRVKVLTVEQNPNQNSKRNSEPRIALSMRALMDDPWLSAALNFKEGGTASGKIVRTQPFGAFVELAPGVDGLIHISELSDRPVKDPKEIVTVGQQVNVTILQVDTTARRISLSLLDQGGSSDELVVGAVVEAIVDSLKPFGLLVKIKGGGRKARGLIPVEESGVSQKANLHKTFKEGDVVKAMIISHEVDTGRMRLSVRAVGEYEAATDYKEFLGGGTDDKKTKGNESSMGSLGALLQKSLNQK